VTLRRILVNIVLVSAKERGTVSATTIQPTSLLGGDLEIDSSPALAFVYCSTVVIHPPNKVTHQLTPILIAEPRTAELGHYNMYIHTSIQMQMC